jgi:hypothetical protein
MEDRRDKCVEGPKAIKQRYPYNLINPVQIIDVALHKGRSKIS